MAANKESLKRGLQKDNLSMFFTRGYSFTQEVEISGGTDFVNNLHLPIGNYSICLKDKSLEENEIKNDFLYRAPLYAPANPTNYVETVKYPNIRQAGYKSILINVVKDLYMRGYIRTWPFTFRYTQDDVFIGNGIILNKNLNILFAIKGDIVKENDKAKFLNPYCVIDKRVFDEKNTANNFIKNTLFPILLELGYRVEIDDFSSVDIFDHPVPPQSYDIKEEITDVLLEGINNYG